MISLRTTSSIWTGLCLLVAAFAVAGCNPFAPKDDNGNGNGNGAHFSKHTADSLLQWFAYAQADPQRNLTDYERCLHTNYTFWFTAQDRAGDPTIPEFWTKEQDVTGTDVLFHGNDVRDPAVHITMSLSVDDTLATELCDPSGTDSCTTYEVLVHMTVEVEQPPPATENLTYLVNGLSDISITKDPLDTNPADGQDYVIYQIVDRTNELGLRAPARATGLAASRTTPADGAGIPVSWGELRRRLAP